jgi:hypothetical protein
MTGRQRFLPCDENTHLEIIKPQTSKRHNLCVQMSEIPGFVEFVLLYCVKNLYYFHLTTTKMPSCVCRVHMFGVSIKGALAAGIGRKMREQAGRGTNFPFQWIIAVSTSSFWETTREAI